MKHSSQKHALFMGILWRIARKRFGKHVAERFTVNQNRRPLLDNGFGYRGITGLFGTTQTWTAVLEPLKAVISVRFSRSYKWRRIFQTEQSPCGGGVEYLHRSPASRRRRRKGKSRIWYSKIWSRVPRNSDPRMTALARTSSYCKRQTRPLVRKSASHQETHSLTVIKIWS
jgi:hypothetical protein